MKQAASINLREILQKQWFIVGVIIAIFAARLNPDFGRKGGPLWPEFTISTLGVAVIFFFSGLSLPGSQLKAALLQVRLHAVVQIWSFVVVPLATSLLVAVLRTLILAVTMTVEGEDLGDAELPSLTLLEGLAIVACMPPPCSTAVILAQAIGGNEAAAVFNATLGSFLGIFLTPLLLLMVVGTPVSVPLGGIVIKLSGMILLPIVLGQAVRVYLEERQKKKTVDLGSPSGSTGERHWLMRIPGGKVASAVLLAIIYTAFCDSFKQNLSLSPFSLFCVVAGVAAVQLLQMQVLFWFSCRREMGFTRQDIITIVFTGVHKSLTLGMPLVSIIFGADPRLVLLTIPLLVWHPVQIIIGSAMVTPARAWLAKPSHPSLPPLQGTHEPIPLRPLGEKP